MSKEIPQLEYKGYKGILALNPKDNRLWGRICIPEHPSVPMDSWLFVSDNIEEAEKLFYCQVERIISCKEFKEKCIEWKSKTDYECIRFYYVTKAWDIILKGELFPIDFKIGPEEEEDCTEADIQEFLAEERATRTRFEACLDNNNMKEIWKGLFNIDIDARTNVERHYWENAYCPLADRVISKELKQRIIKAFYTDWENRFGFYLDDGWIYVYRSFVLLARFQLKKMSDGTFRIVHCQKSDESKLYDMDNRAIECAAYSVEHNRDLINTNNL